ncbi:hypothetical protein ACEWY4_025440 [Coilia grayii]|uniref:Arb2 domain-containing protein n=1 Tax=Coilia grayii TaxID=363190 RepID=A0ABD1IZB4_9TELE
MLVRVVSCLFLFFFNIAQMAQEDKEKTTALKDLLSRIDLDELMKKDEPPLTFPKTLEEFEYAFNDRGQLRHTKTGEAFVFNYREDLHRWNQKRYEALGEIITQYVYERLEEECNLTREILPVDATEDEPKSFIYLSEDALTNPDKLLVLIQGSGVVRAGQWARRLIINEDMDSGSQLPFIKRAIEGGGAQRGSEARQRGALEQGAGGDAAMPLLNRDEERGKVRKTGRKETVREEEEEEEEEEKEEDTKECRGGEREVRKEKWSAEMS